MSALENDLIPYGMAIGNRAHLSGLNIVGLQRRGFSREDIHSLRRAYRLLFADEGTLVERMEDVEKEFSGHPIVAEILAFIREGGKRGCACLTPSRELGGAGGFGRARTRDCAGRAPVDRPMTRIGILAGGGRLPLTIAESVAARGGQVHIVGIDGEADPSIARFPHTWVNWGQIGRMVSTLRSEGGGEMVIAGGVRRPDLWKLRPDLGFFSACRRSWACSRAATIRCCRGWCASSRPRD